jgi:hypothetical protein
VPALNCKGRAFHVPPERLPRRAVRGLGARSPIKPVPSTHSKTSRSQREGQGSRASTLQQRNRNVRYCSPTASCSRFVCSVWFGPPASSCRRNPSCFTILLIAFPGFPDAAVSWHCVWSPWHCRLALIRSFGCPSLPPITFCFGNRTLALPSHVLKKLGPVTALGNRLTTEFTWQG